MSVSFNFYLCSFQSSLNHSRFTYSYTSYLFCSSAFAYFTSLFFYFIYFCTSLFVIRLAHRVSLEAIESSQRAQKYLTKGDEALSSSFSLSYWLCNSSFKPSPAGKFKEMTRPSTEEPRTSAACYLTHYPELLQYCKVAPVSAFWLDDSLSCWACSKADCLLVLPIWRFHPFFGLRQLIIMSDCLCNKFGGGKTVFISYDISMLCIWIYL